MSVYRNSVAIQLRENKNVIAVINTYSLKDLKEDFVSGVEIFSDSFQNLKNSVKRLMILSGEGDSFNMPGTRLTIHVKPLFEGRLLSKVHLRPFPLGERQVLETKDGRQVQMFAVALFNDQSSLLQQVVAEVGMTVVKRSEKSKSADSGKEKADKKKNKGKTKKETKSADLPEVKTPITSETSPEEHKKKKDRKKKKTDLKRQDTTSSLGSTVNSTDSDATLTAKNIMTHIIEATPEADLFMKTFHRRPVGDELGTFLSIYNNIASRLPRVEETLSEKISSPQGDGSSEKFDSSASDSGTPTKTSEQSVKPLASWIDQADEENNSKDQEIKEASTSSASKS